METKTIRLQIRTTPKIKKWIKKNKISQTEVFDSAIKKLMEENNN
jgi:predicted XRE-type DNA-binding protein